MKCKFYDDGCGNRNYMSGASCGPPNCNMSKTPLTPKCDGIIKKCEIDSHAAKVMTERILELEKDLKNANNFKLNKQI